jgi:hypothetical protein
MLPLRAAGLLPAQVRLVLPSLNVTVPMAPDVTTAVRVTELFGALVYAVVRLGASVVVLGVEAVSVAARAAEAAKHAKQRTSRQADRRIVEVSISREERVKRRRPCPRRQNTSIPSPGALNSEARQYPPEAYRWQESICDD